MNNPLIRPALFSLLLLMTASLPAVKTAYTIHATEQQFKTGDPNNLTISADGQIHLSRQTQTIYTDDNSYAINDLIQISNTIYIAANGKNLIYSYRADTPDSTPKPIYLNPSRPDAHPDYVFSLGRDKNNQLLAGATASGARLVRFSPKNKPEIIWSSDEILYIWSIVTGPSGRLYLATGPTGKIITLDSEGTNEQLLYKAGEKNILSLALSPSGRLYAGGDEFGLIYQIDPSTGQTTVLYDTGHKEVSQLLIDSSQNLYASTSDVQAAKAAARQIILSNNDTSHSEKDTYKSEPSSQLPAVRPDSNQKNNHPSPPSPSGSQSGNEIFKISPEGFVTSLFSQPLLVHSMALTPDQQLLIGVGTPARLITLDPETTNAEVLYENRISSQLTAMIASPQTLLGLSNPLALIQLKDNYQPSGYYLSESLDAKQVSRWGLIQIQARTPNNTQLKIQTRTGNTADPHKGGWQPWTTPQTVSTLNPVKSLPGRFLQYKLLFSTDAPKLTPTVTEVKCASQIPNLPPKLQLIDIKRPVPKPSQPDRPDPAHSLKITWKAQDDNQDSLLFNLYIRPLNTKRWILLKKDLPEPLFTLDDRTLAQGWYEFKVQAVDLPDNDPSTARTATRVSQPIIIDNTPPEITNLAWHPDKNNIVISLQVNDSFSVIDSLEYALNSSEEWKLALPTDGIYDNTAETFNLILTPETSDQHLLTIRVRDTFDNVRYRNLTIEN